MLPQLGSSKLVNRWIYAIVIASLIAALDGGWLAYHAALVPARVFRGELWRLVTWPLVASGPWSLVCGCAAIYKLGGDLAYRWGDRRLQRFVIEVVLAASVATCVVAAVLGGTGMARLGGWVFTDIVVIAWARQFPRAPLQLYGLLTLSGRQLVGLVVASAAAYVLYLGVGGLPELFACAAAATYSQKRLRHLISAPRLRARARRGAASPPRRRARAGRDRR